MKAKIEISIFYNKITSSGQTETIAAS